MIKGRFFLLVPLVLVLGLGCTTNPNTAARVSGTVKYKDKLVTAGTVTFHPTNAGPYTIRPIASDGTYSATDMPVGDYVVTVETESASGKAPSKQYGGGRNQQNSPMPTDFAPAAQGEYVPIPKKYADKKTSGFTKTLTAGRNTVNLDMTD
jgi:hypothetical protein